MAQVFCSACGQPVTADAAFCAKCGARTAAAPTGGNPYTVPTTPRPDYGGVAPHVRPVYVAPPPPPAKRRGFLKTAGIGCLGLLGVLVLIGIIANASTAPGRAPQSAAVGSAGAAAPKPVGTEAGRPGAPVATLGSRTNPHPLGSDVVVDEVRWKILSAETKPYLPEAFGTTMKMATGRYIVVVVEVENLGKSLKSVTNLELFDDRERKFTAVSDRFTLKPEQLLILSNLNPNVPQRYSDVFEVPADAKGLTVTVSNLAFLGAKTVHVSLNQ